MAETGETRGDGGVTLDPPVKVSTQRFCWCFTHNGYDPETVETFETTLQQLCSWFVFQEETGAAGNKHLQGVVYLKARARLSQMKQINPAIHWEPTKSISASQAYCSAEAKRTGKLFVHGVKIASPVDLEEPRGWQLEVIGIIQTKPDKRTIHWFWESVGGVGKTTLCKFLVVRHNALIVNGKSENMFHALASNPSRREVIVVNCPRSMQDYMNYGAIEMIKDGLVYSGKYEGAQLVFNCPHVFVFANTPPAEEKMSAGRWHVVHIVTSEVSPVRV